MTETDRIDARCSQQFAKAQNKTVGAGARRGAESKAALRRIGQPEDIAALALFLCRAARAAHPGHRDRVDGGATPGLLISIEPRLRSIVFTISIARRSSVIEASSVRKAACAVSVTFGSFASG